MANGTRMDSFPVLAQNGIECLWNNWVKYLHNNDEVECVNRKQPVLDNFVLVDVE